MGSIWPGNYYANPALWITCPNFFERVGCNQSFGLNWACEAMKNTRTMRRTPKSIDAYISRFPFEVRGILKKIRTTIRKAAPGAEETISYQIPAFALEGYLVYFAAFKSHIGFYPRTTAIAKFKKELAAYKGAKGSVQFPLDQPIPYGLISKIVKFRVKENLRRAEMKRRRKDQGARGRSG